MDIHMHSHHLESRTPDWMAAVVAGFVGGAAVMVLELLWSALIQKSNPWLISHMISAIVMGQNVLQSSDFNVSVVATALITHYLLGIVFGLVLCGIIAAFHFDSSMSVALATGAVFGVLLYVFNFYGMAHLFAWFAEMRGWAALVIHMLFGMVSAGAYCTLERGNGQRHTQEYRG